MQVAVWQAPALAENIDLRLKRLREAAQDAARRGVELLVTPELYLAGDAPLSGLARLAERSDGPNLAAIGPIAAQAGVALAVGYAEACSERIHSSLILVSADGQAFANYRRTHVTGHEEDVIARGAWMSCAKLDWRKLGLLIGYDILFPEAARSLIIAGADLLIVAGGGRPSHRDVLTKVLAARAAENGVALAYAEPAAADGALSGGSCILDPKGNALAAAAKDTSLIIAEMPHSDPDAALRLSDRRPRLYTALAHVDAEPAAPATSGHPTPRPR